MKLRNFVWPVVILGSLSLAGACSSDSNGSGGTGGTGGDAAAGDGNDAAGTKTMGGSANGGASDGGAGGDAIAGGGVGGAGADLCEGLDLKCTDDDNPCTEDECNPATGKCGIPRTGTSCDDGKFCNGDDTCNEGECTEHAGDPCNGQTCNEGGNYCECTKDEDCPADAPGEWSECTFATTCVEMGNRSRSVDTFSCVKGACVQKAAIENEACPRETDGLSCDDGLRCNGTDKCKNGNCDHTGNPCAGGAADADGCWEKGTMCRGCGQDGAECGNKSICCDSGGTTASCKIGLTCGIVISNFMVDPLP